MKILQINVVCGVGSTGRIAVDLNKTIHSHKHEGLIAFGRRYKNNLEDSFYVGNKFYQMLHLLQTRIFDNHGFCSAAITRKFLKIVDKYNPDLIHLHNIHGYYLHVGILFDYLKILNKPIVWTLHDCWAFTGHCTHFDYFGCNRWKTVCFDCPLKNMYPKSWIFDQSKRNFKKKMMYFSGISRMAVVTPSSWLSGLVNDSFLSNYPVSVINNGVDLNLFKPCVGQFRYNHQLKNLFLLVAVASEWNSRKGLDYLIELTNHLNDNQILIVVGLNKSQMSKFPSNVICISRVDNVSDLVDIYSSADVFVNPTLEDSFPTVNIESLACGTPVVTFDSGGSGEMVGENCGHVVVRGDFDSLLSGISDVYRKSKRYFSASCRLHAEKYFDKNKQFEKYIHLYDSLTSEI